MSQRRREAIWVGLFVLLAGVLLLAALMWIAGARMFRPVDTYTVIFDDSVSGLNPGATVEFAGVIVGQVKDVGLTRGFPPRVAVTIEVEPGTPVQKDTTAALAGSLVTGIKFIELRGGSEAAGKVPLGGVIDGDVASLEEFRDQVTEVAGRAINILRHLDEEVFTRENSANLAGFMDDLGTVAEDLRVTMESFRRQEFGEDVERVVEQVSRLAANTDRLITELHGRQDEILDGLSITLQHVDTAVMEMRDFVRGARAQFATTGESLNLLLGELLTITGGLEETLDVIRSDPSVLIRGRELPAREFDR